MRSVSIPIVRITIEPFEMYEILIPKTERYYLLAMSIITQTCLPLVSSIILFLIIAAFAAILDLMVSEVTFKFIPLLANAIWYGRNKRLNATQSITRNGMELKTTNSRHASQIFYGFTLQRSSISNSESSSTLGFLFS